jgi:sialic acid synthase SpsE
MIIKNPKIGSGEKIFIIAEMAWSHDGSVENARKIITGAAEAGADAISLHITSLKDCMVKDYRCLAGQTLSAGKKKISIYDYLNKINLKNNDWKKIFNYARNLGLIICAMPNDIPSVKLCKKLNPDIYVISSACFIEENLVSEIAKQKKPLILRIGGATLGEIENTINLIKKEGGSDITLLHGIQSYPTKIEDTHLNLIPSLKKIFGLPVGLADHIDADSELSLIIPLMAIPMGAEVIEKHITHNRSLKGEDFEAALNPDEFKKFVEYIRKVEKALGKSHFRDFSEAELKYRKVSRKKTVVSKIINKNEKITKENITFKRSDEGVYPDESKFLIGRIAKKNIKKDESLTWDKVL